MNSQPIDSLPLWAVYLILLIIMLGAVELGYRYAKLRSRKGASGSDAGLGAISGATLGSVAFLLAIVVGFGMDLTGTRRELVIQEANSIRSAYLRTGYLQEPYRTDSRVLLSDYLDQRLAAQDRASAQQARVRSEEIQAELWSLADEYVTDVDKSDTTSAYVDSLDEVTTVHHERVVKGLQVRIPPPLLWAMLLVSFVGMFLAGMASGYGPNRSIIGLVMMVVVFSVVLYLLFDLDRSQEGLIRVSVQPLVDLQAQLSTLP